MLLFRVIESACTQPVYITANCEIRRQWRKGVKTHRLSPANIGSMHVRRVDFRNPLHSYAFSLFDRKRVIGRF